MVNICKLSINVVNDNKPKMLIGLAKRQAAWFGGSILPSLRRRHCAAGGQTGPKRSKAFGRIRAGCNMHNCRIYSNVDGKDAQRGKPVNSSPRVVVQFHYTG